MRRTLAVKPEQGKNANAEALLDLFQAEEEEEEEEPRFGLTSTCGTAGVAGRSRRRRRRRRRSLGAVFSGDWYWAAFLTSVARQAWLDRPKLEELYGVHGVEPCVSDP
jgi:hypothetical protein